MAIQMPQLDSAPSFFNPDSGNTIIVALDDSAITGPEAELRDMEATITRTAQDGADAVLGFPGLFRRYGDVLRQNNVSGILNLTLSTEGNDHLRKVQVTSVDAVGQLGLAAASVHVNTTAPHEPEMLRTLGQVAEECNKLGIPLLAHMYPRTIKDGKEYHYEDMREEDPEAYAKLVRHAARIAADLGADIIKAPYTGDADTFHMVVESTYGLPVVMAGGPLTSIPQFLESAQAAMEAGARGIAVGRNFFQQPIKTEGDLVLLALQGMVHDGYNRFDASLKAEGVLAARTSDKITRLVAAGELIPGVSDLSIFDEPRTFSGTWYGLRKHSA